MTNKIIDCNYCDNQIEIVKNKIIKVEGPYFKDLIVPHGISHDIAYDFFIECTKCSKRNDVYKFI